MNAVGTHLSKHGDQLRACGIFRGCEDGPSKTTDPIMTAAGAAEITLQSFPNPFNDEVNIIVSTNIDSEDNLKLFDVKGKLVQVLLDQKFEAGKKYGVDSVPNGIPTGL